MAGLPASGGRTRAGVHNFLKSLDSGPFDKPFDTLRVPSDVEGLTALSKVEGQVTSDKGQGTSSSFLVTRHLSLVTRMRIQAFPLKGRRSYAKESHCSATHT